MAADVLFQPFAFKGLRLKNRIVMAPMTRSFSPGGVPTEQVAQYYRRRAAAEVGLIVSEGTGVNRPASLNDPNVPRFHGEKELAGWKRVIDQVHEAGGVMAPQLWHVGAVKTRDPVWTPPGPYDSPSGLSRPEKQFGEPMSEADVADAIAAFADAARAAKDLGFEAVELHGAHGYLIDQFFWEGTNVREDAYGSKDLTGRARFAADILRAVRRAVGPDYPVIIRISQWKQQDYAVKLAHDPKALEAWLGALVDAGADILHCSQRRFWEPEFEGSDLNFAGWAKKLTGVPTITVGSVGLTGEFIASWGGEQSQPASLDELERRLDRGDFDLVGVGRALLQDPEWVLKVKEGRTNELMSYDRAALATLS
ncbi:MAG: NADH:flavin oxidoreductase [Phenylobacterium sp.]|uniref:NADH:flavin oxidoreductase n=1 Tax=Phenylobacterium sp. TaxID=1871053 RepID=UPI00391A28C9